MSLSISFVVSAPWTVTGKPLTFHKSSSVLVMLFYRKYFPPALLKGLIKIASEELSLKLKEIFLAVFQTYEIKH